ncbi:MAG: hypothetical protein HY695_35985 [Deltaproteobacteria bacterium]|nr:hypothetical protein [Deltaproteobacteria bacterium]
MKPLSWLGGLACLPGTALLILFGFGAGILSCAQVVSEESVLSESLPSKTWTVGEFVGILSQRIEDFRSLRALATVNYSGPDGRAGFQEAVIVHRPDRLRLETLSPLGVILIVTADADELAGFHTREGLFYRGRSSKQNLLYYTQIPLELREITALLMGLPPVSLQPGWEGEGNSLYRDVAGGRREKVAFHVSLGVPASWERSGQDGTPELSAQFSDYSATTAGPFPHKIVLEARAPKLRLEIRYQEPEVNVSLPSGLFVQQKPGNAKEIPLESLGG